MAIEEGNGANQQSRPRKRILRKRKNNDKRKRYAQDIYRKCPSKLGELVWRNQLEGFLKTETVAPPVKDIENTFRELWSTIDEYEYKEEEGLLLPFSCNEIKAKI